jgi:urease accessory protein
MVPSLAAVLALADQRLPSGGHVHSGGAEQAVAEGLVRDAATLHTFLRRRLLTAGRLAAGIAAAATSVTATDLPLLDAETDARLPSPAQRDASRAQGRGLLRTARAAWAAPHADLTWADLGQRPHHPIVLGCAARAAAAQRLLGLDPIAVAAATIALGDEIESVAAEALRAFAAGELPDDGDPLLDLLAQRHAAKDLTLFSS